MRLTTYGRRRGLAAAAAVASLTLVACSSGGTPGTTTSGSSAAPTSTSPTTGSATAGPTSPSATPSISSSTSPTTPPQGFAGSPVSGGDSGTSQSRLLQVTVGSHPGYDRLVLTFGADPVPEFTVTPQASAAFPMDPSDELATLKGTSGVRVVTRSTLLAPTALVDDMRPGYPAIREVQQIGNFEAVVSYAVGVAGSPALVRVTTLTSPNRLVIDVAWPTST